MRISNIVKSLCRPITNIITSVMFNSLFDEKEWLRNYFNRKSFLNKLVYGLILEHYKRKMIYEGGMIGIQANFLTPPYYLTDIRASSFHQRLP